MASRYELSEAHWERVKDFLPGRKEHVGRTAADNRFRQRVSFGYCALEPAGVTIPERYGKYKSVHKRFVRWAHSGVWERISHELVRDKKEPVPDDRFHAGSRSPAGRHGRQKKGDKALGRSRGGLTTKIHLLVDELGLPQAFLLTGGQISVYTPAIELLGQRESRSNHCR